MDQRARDYKEMVREETALLWRTQKPFEITQDTRFVLRLWMFLEKNSRDVDANIKLVMDGVIQGIKDTVDLEGLSDLRVFRAELEKAILREMDVGPSPYLTVEVSEWRGYGEAIMSSADLYRGD